MRPVNKNISISYLRPFIATAMVASGLMNLAAPIYAAGTAAGTDISNTATATYEDPNGGLSNTTSNTVKIAVAEVAGITITSTGVTNVGNTAIAATGALTPVTTTPVADDKLVFTFDVTNTGNDTTSFHIPNVANVGGSPVQVLGVEYLDGTTWKNVDTANNTIATKADGTPILPGDSVKVRVITQVNSGATTGAIKVTLGNTGASDLSNVPYAADGGSVYTVDNDGTLGDVAGVPSNGVMEAAASGTSAVNPGKQAFVKITETAVTDNNNSPNVVTDDKITYKMTVDVAGTAPTGTNKVADDLAATPVKFDGNVVNKILVSNAIPVGTVLDSVAPAPAGWTIVYSTDPIGATAANDPSVAWTTTAPGTLSSVTRIGYVKDGTIAKGTTVPGFEFTVLTSGIPASGGSVLDIAQVFGTTPLDAAGTPDITKPAMDESGDNQFNNLNADGTPGPTPTNGVATASNGLDPNDPATPGTSGTSNGTGPGGETTITSLVPANQAIGVSNGPANQPGATGPSGGTNDDFTNKSVTIDATDAKRDPVTDLPLPVNPQALGFANTVKNDSPTTPALISLLPTAPATKTDLPDGTLVKILANGQAAVYEYDQPTGTFTLQSGSLITLNVPAGTTANYGVEVDLPAGTAQMTGFPVSITAFADGTPAIPQPNGTVTPAVPGNGVIDPTDAQNVSIDRVYTGYVKLMKEAQVTKADGTIVSPFSAAAPKAAPGQFIEYRIKYNNITEAAPTGSGSVGLAANNVKILEDGTLPPNNWATLSDNKASSASDSLGGTIKYDNGAKTASDAVVNQYLDMVPTLAPGAAGQFSFTRVVK